MTKKIKVLAGGVLAAMLLLPAGTAMATSAWAYDGSELVAHAWAPAQNDPGKVAIKDSSAGNWVKVEYRRTSSGDKHTLWNKAGSGTTAYSGGGARVYEIHACEDIDWGPDNCSGWVPVG
jgi:hypothetical protein